MFKNIASQKIALFAFDTSSGAPKTGDAANLTAYVSKDYGAVTVLGDTSATEMDATNAKGWYLFDVTQAETNGDALLFSGKSSTANISVVGALVFTLPPSFTSFAAQTGDSYARLGAPALASHAADVAAVAAKTVNLPPDPADASDIATAFAAVPTANANADALLDRANGVETGLTLRQWLRLGGSVLFGKASGLATNTPAYRDFADTKPRVSAVTDASGNRTSVTRDAT